MEGISCGIQFEAQKYSCSPLLLLHLNEEGYMMPLAIQLFANKPEIVNPVWTPKDEPNEWLLAKMFFNNGADNVQLINCHLLRTHFFSEPFAVALRRCFARNHPIYRLMLPHSMQVA